MPKVTMELEIECRDCGSGEMIALDLFSFLCSNMNREEWRPIGYTFLGSSLSEDEIAEMRFTGEGGND